MPFTWYRLKADARAVSPMNSALGAKLSTPGFTSEARTGVLSGTSENAHEITPQEAEITRLKSEIARKEQEIQLLRKFAAYLSSTGLK